MGAVLCGARNKVKGTLKILILGISGSGKSTFTKQMKILFTEGFSDEERVSYREIVRSNVIIGIKELSDQANQRSLDLSEKNRKYMRYFRENDPLELKLVSNNVLHKVKSLWHDESIQLAWEACRNYQIQVSQIDYFMENLERITQEEYVPTDEDIVRARQRTAGAYITRFTAFKHIWEIIDVGGQAPERRKWMNIVNQQTDLTSIIYFAALDEYNMESSEEAGKTKMEVSMKVFGDIVSDAQNFDKCTILFLNKTDLFREKILSEKGLEEMKERFPDFENYLENEFLLEDDVQNLDIKSEEDNLYQAGLKFIENKFRELCSDKKKLVVYKTCAIDTSKIHDVFTAMKDYIFIQRMTKTGLFKNGAEN